MEKISGTHFAQQAGGGSDLPLQYLSNADSAAAKMPKCKPDAAFGAEMPGKPRQFLSLAKGNFSKPQIPSFQRRLESSPSYNQILGGKWGEGMPSRLRWDDGVFRSCPNFRMLRSAAAPAYLGNCAAMTYLVVSGSAENDVRSPIP